MYILCRSGTSRLESSVAQSHTIMAAWKCIGTSCNRIKNRIAKVLSNRRTVFILAHEALYQGVWGLSRLFVPGVLLVRRLEEEHNNCVSVKRVNWRSTETPGRTCIFGRAWSISHILSYAFNSWEQWTRDAALLSLLVFSGRGSGSRNIWRLDANLRACIMLEPFAFVVPK